MNISPGGGEPPKEATSAAPKKPTGPSHATLLAKILKVTILWHTPDGEAFVSIPVAKAGENMKTEGHVEHWPVRSKKFRDWLARVFFKRYEKTPSSQAVEDALRIAEGQAQFDGPELTVHLRIARDETGLYLDLGDEKWRAVKCAPEGWEVVLIPPIPFRRSKGMLPLPDPERGGTLADLEVLINVESDDDFQLAVSWLFGGLHPNGPYTILILNGVQGSSKSTAARLLRTVTDPNSCPIRAAPRQERDLMVAGHNNRVLAFDNLSWIPPWLSDALCRIATGGGFSARELYSDKDESLIQIKRPLILNGIPELATQPDLCDRAIVIDLPALTGKRMTEADIDRRFEAAWPRILGVLLDAVCCALRRESEIAASGILLPRMADFARWVIAAAPVLERDGGPTFLAAYEDNRRKLVASLLQNDEVLVPRIRMLLDKKETWSGTASQLKAQLQQLDSIPVDSVSRGVAFPKTPNALSAKLKRLTPALEAVGIFVEWGIREPGTGTRIIRISRKDVGVRSDAHRDDL